MSSLARILLGLIETLVGSSLVGGLSVFRFFFCIKVVKSNFPLKYDYGNITNTYIQIELYKVLY